MSECTCRACERERGHQDGLWAPGRPILFIVCPVCGNKRCPKATDHRNECTGSNEQGQVGSVFRKMETPA